MADDDMFAQLSPEDKKLWLKQFSTFGNAFIFRDNAGNVSVVDPQLIDEHLVLTGVGSDGQS